MGGFVCFIIVLTLFYRFSLQCVSTKFSSSEIKIIENLMNSHVDKFSNRDLLVVLFSTSDIVGNVSGPSEGLFTFDLMPKIRKPTCVFRFFDFIYKYNQDYLKNIIFNKVD